MVRKSSLEVVVADGGRLKKRKRRDEEKITRWLKSRGGSVRETDVSGVKRRGLNKENTEGSPFLEKRIREAQTQVLTREKSRPPEPPLRVTMKVGNEKCPVASCENHGGRGFRNLQSHLERQHRETLENCEGD